MNKFKSVVIAMVLVLLNLSAWAQTTPTAPLQPQVDMMRSNGKIYVVMTVVIVIITGLFIYLFSVDRKVTRLENRKP